MPSPTQLRDAGPTLMKIDQFMAELGLTYWLEAGTALAAARDGKIFPWEHDIDIAVWKEQQDKALLFADKMATLGWKATVQKGFPFIDNIIQLRWAGSDNDRPFPDQVDIYIYSKESGYAYMRWLQAPVGRAAAFQKTLFLAGRSLVTGKSRRFGKYYRLIPWPVRAALFRAILYYHVKTATCIFHRFPAEFFDNLSRIDFYGVKIPAPAKIDEFLSYRYGANWKIPDSNFNQSGKWRKSSARVPLRMSTLPIPQVDRTLLTRFGY